MCSVMLTLLLFSLSFREKKRRRIEELLAEKLVLPGGGGPSPGTPASPHPRPRGPAAAAPGGWEGGTRSAGRAASFPDPRPAAPGDRRSAPVSLSQAGIGPGVHRSKSGAGLPECLTWRSRGRTRAPLLLFHPKLSETWPYETGILLRHTKWKPGYFWPFVKTETIVLIANFLWELYMV